MFFRFAIAKFFTIVFTLICATTTSAISIIERDGTSSVDAYNVILCLMAGGFGNDTNVAVDVSGGLLIHSPSASRNSTHADMLMVACKTRFGYNISLALYKGEIADDTFTTMGTATDALIGTFTLPNFTRDIYENPSTIGNPSDSMSIETTETNANRTLNKRGKYAAYYNMEVSLSRECSSVELFYTYSDTCQDDQASPFYAYRVYNPSCEVGVRS